MSIVPEPQFYNLPNFFNQPTNYGQPVCNKQHYRGQPICLSADGTTVATVHNNSIIVFANDHHIILEGHTLPPSTAAFSPDGTRLVSGDYDTIRIWDTASGTCLQVLREHASEVYSVAFSPDGKRVVSGSHDKTLRIWDAASGVLVSGPLIGPATRVFSVAFSPDGRRVVSGSSDGKVRIWDAASGDCVICKGHISYVTSLAFSPDGRRVVSGSTDKTVRIWDAASGQLQLKLRAYDDKSELGLYGGVTAVAFSPVGGNQVMSASWKGGACVHRTFNLKTWSLHAREVSYMNPQETPVNWYLVVRNPVTYVVVDVTLRNTFRTELANYANNRLVWTHQTLERLPRQLSNDLRKIILSYGSYIARLGV